MVGSEEQNRSAMGTDPRQPTLAFLVVRILVAIGVPVAGLLLLTVFIDDDVDPSTLAIRIVGGAVLSVAAFLVIVALSRSAGHRSLEGSGIDDPENAWLGVLSGALAWLVPAAATFTVLGMLGASLTIEGSPPQLFTIPILVALAVLLSEAVPEEIVFRGYVTGVLEERLRGWWVVIAQAALFAATAALLRGGANPIDLSLFVTMGLVLGYSRMVSGSVWIAVGFHAAFQTGSQLVLTHDIIQFSGARTQAMVALGIVPFSIGVTALAILASVRAAENQ